ncbi:MAG: nucleotidyltransferase domain-containing protein [Armatimonadetes bacterium]|nr:nucleotidyltransferase domain-containing protein [Armatimonadota bacterium]
MEPVDEQKKHAIQDALHQVSQEHGVRILYACESGSRAWGFASPDSDYDVRFVYVHPIDWYLSVEQGRDVIERMLPGDIDLAGWELRKTLGLLRKSNPPLFEWTRCPLVYHRDDDLWPGFLAVAEAYYSPDRCFFHYLSMAQGNLKDYLLGPDVQLKKYLYVLRPLFACLWLERQLSGETRPCPVPMEFDALRHGLTLSDGLQSAVDDLLLRKVAGLEKETSPRIEPISAFIETELPRLAGVAVRPGPLPDTSPLDGFLRSAIMSASQVTTVS